MDGHGFVQFVCMSACLDLAKHALRNSSLSQAGARPVPAALWRLLTVEDHELVVRTCDEPVLVLPQYQPDVHTGAILDAPLSPDF